MNQKPAITIIEAIADPIIIGDTLSPAQIAALKALYGLEMSPEELRLARKCAGKAWRPGVEYLEAAVVCGRRAGKSDKLAANVAIYEGMFREHNLSVGETGVVLLLAQNMRQAKIVKDYIAGKIKQSPILRQHLLATRANELELDNGITIAIYPASFRSIRGLSVVCCICDEIAFWWTEENYANPDVEVIRAVRPAMATCPSAKLLMISSPYTMTGVLWEAWRERDEDDEVLVWHAPTALMNPTVPRQFLERAKRRDPEDYRREYLAEFTDAVSAFLSSEAIEARVVKGKKEVPPDSEVAYVAAIDAAYKGDRFTLCIGHYDRGTEKLVIDVLRGWQGTQSQPLRAGIDVIPEIKALNNRYGFEVVHADQFGAEPLKELFQRSQLQFEEHPFTNASKADMYAALRTRIVEGTIELLDHEQSLRELRGLQLEKLAGGTLRIGHAGHGKARDDFADAIALAVSELAEYARPMEKAMSAGIRESYVLCGDPRL